MVEDFATYVTLEELPFSHGESPNLEYMVKHSLNPAFRKIPRNTLKRHTQKQYYAQRAQLIEYFRDFDGMVSLTSDCWSSSQGEPYICVTVHWISSDYLLEKRIIAFDVMDESHSGYNIKQRILDTIKEFNLFNKVFTISLDNAAANKKAIDYIRPDIPLALDGIFLHVRCCAHIINLSAQKGISQLTHLLEPIRKVIKYLRFSGTYRSKYKKLCKDNGLRPKKWGIDCCTRWSSTYKLLNDAIQYKTIITELYNEDPSHQYDDGLITEQAWELASTVRDILACFAHATTVFSYVYQPNVHHVIIECVSIVITLKEYEENEFFSAVIFDMKVKWIEYFTDFPYIYGVACLLDPGVRKEGLENMLEHYYQVLGVSYNHELYVTNCLGLLYRLVDIYAPKIQSSIPPKSSSSVSRFNSTISSILSKKQKVRISESSSVPSSAFSMVREFFSYHYELNDDFEILTWWKNHELQFPVLAKIVKDILVVPASTIASESAFSAGRRVLDEKRSSLSPDVVKICVCKKDWDQAAKRQQGNKEDNSDGEDDPWMTMNTSDSDTSTTHEQQ